MRGICEAPATSQHNKYSHITLKLPTSKDSAINIFVGQYFMLYHALLIIISLIHSLSRDAGTFRQMARPRKSFHEVAG